MPDKAIDVVDEAASKVRLKTFTMPPEIKILEERIEELEKDKENFIKTEEYEKAGEAKKVQSKLREELNKVKASWKDSNVEGAQVVGEEEVVDIIASWTGIAIKRLQEEESERLRNMESILHERVIGQEDAISAISKAIR